FNASAIHTGKLRLKPYGAVFIAFVVCISLGYWSFSGMAELQLMLFLLTGIVFSFRISKPSGPRTLLNQVGPCIVFIWMAFLLWYAWRGVPDNRIWSGTAAFLLPVSFRQSWLWYGMLNGRSVKLWEGGDPTPAAEKYTLLMHNLSLRFRVTRVGQRKAVSYKLQVPAGLQLGKAFFYLKAKQKEKDQQEAYGFFLKQWGGGKRTPLDPERTLKENGVKANDVIYVQVFETNNKE
ncbi:MAG TPA: hypothetical protein VHK91_08280, partial [Flavisolibacter sp.]|nr:hypothetical protein [Flavisolibacter sp.]